MLSPVSCQPHPTFMARRRVVFMRSFQSALSAASVTLCMPVGFRGFRGPLLPSLGGDGDPATQHQKCCLSLSRCLLSPNLCVNHTMRNCRHRTVHRFTPVAWCRVCTSRLIAMPWLVGPALTLLPRVCADLSEYPCLERMLVSPSAIVCS